MTLKQKVSAMLVLSLFLLSVLPMGFADEKIVEVDGDTENKSEDDTETEVEAEAEVEDTEKDSAKRGVKIIRKEVKEVRKDVQKARARLLEAKEQYKEAREDQREHRLKVLELNKLAKRCNPEEEDCSTLKVELRLGVKNHLLKSVQVVERSLEKLTKTVEKMEDLSAEEKEFALALVADLEAELDTQKAKIDSFTNETSPEEIRSAIKDLKELNQKVHKLQRRLVGLLVNAKLHVLVEKQAELHAGMQARIDALAQTGADVSELEAILAEFDAKVAELEEDYQAAQQKWMEAKDAEDFDPFNRALREAQLEVRKGLQEIKKILREFLAEYKEIKEGQEESEDAENETEETEGINESEETVNETDSNEVESNTSLEVNASAEATA